jgi:hypothetical protein
MELWLLDCDYRTIGNYFNGGIFGNMRGFSLDVIDEFAKIYLLPVHLVQCEYFYCCCWDYSAALPFIWQTIHASASNSTTIGFHPFLTELFQ